METTMRLGGLALLTVTVLGCGSSPVMATYTGEEWTDTFMQADFTRFFRVHVPERTELGPAAPLVLVFHGSSQTGERIEAVSGLNRVADSAGFIVAYLEAPMGAWDVFDNLGSLGLDDLGYVREVIARIDRRYVIDAGRIIATGLSNGGVFAQRLGCDMADRIAGFVAVAASMPRLLAENCRPTRPMSALYILGTADGFFPADGNSVLLSFDGTMQFWATANDCKGSRIRTTLPDRHDDGTVAHTSGYRFCDNSVPTTLDSIVGGGHAWPGGAIPAPQSFGPTSQEISANAEIARFLRRIPRR